MKRLHITDSWKKVEEIRICHIADDNPDLTFLGEFANLPGQFPIRHSDDPGQFRYFNAFNVCNEAEARQNYERMMQFCNGDICMMRIKVKAKIINSLSILIPGGTENRISSSGLWNIESDSDKKYIEEIEREKLSEMKDILTTLGFTTKQIGDAPIKRD